jgi:hypothetical protein
MAHDEKRPANGSSCAAQRGASAPAEKSGNQGRRAKIASREVWDRLQRRSVRLVASVA